MRTLQRTLTILVFLLTGSPAVASDAESTALPTIASIPSLPDLSGCWSGEWRSCQTGHRGPMTADFCRLRCHCYEVTFKGRFCKLIPFRYKAILHASVGEDGSVVLTGSKNLGLLFGTFRFRGSVDGCRLHANYCSKDDTGTFHLSRR